MSKQSKHRAEKRKEKADRKDDRLDLEDQRPVEPRVTEKLIMAPLLDPAEVNRLLKASDTPYKAPTRAASPYLNYPTYNQYECIALLHDKPIEQKFSKKK